MALPAKRPASPESTPAEPKLRLVALVVGHVPAEHGRRLAWVREMLVTVTTNIHHLTGRLSLSMPQSQWIDCRARLSRMEQDHATLIAERTRLHQCPPQGLAERRAEAAADLAAARATLERADITEWLRGVNAALVERLEIEVRDIDRARWLAEARAEGRVSVAAE